MHESDHEVSKDTTQMAIQIETYHQTEFAQLRADWERLQQGEEMTYFQTWEWNKMLLHAVPNDSAHFETIFLLIKRDCNAEMIVPLWIIKQRYRYVHRPMITLLGQGGWSDYLNAIYLRFCEEVMNAVMDYLRVTFPTLPLHFSSLKEGSSLYHYVHQHYDITTDITGDCVSLFLPNKQEEWLQSLSKNTRQNLRTAINRLDKDGITYVIDFDDTSVDKQVCIANRTRRSKMKAVRDERVSWRKKVTRWIKRMCCSLPTQGGYLPILDDPNAKIMTISTVDGQLMAYFHYGHDMVHREIVVISAGVMEEYARYSPGMVLMKNYVAHAIETKAVDVIDFTRGDEPYKIALGGVRKINHTIQFAIS